MILKCISKSCQNLRDDENDHSVPETPTLAAGAANNDDGVAHLEEEIVKKEKSKCFSLSCWQKVIIKLKKESCRNKKLGKQQAENVYKDESDQLNESPGRYRNEASFNLGVGFGLVYHSAAFRDELNKMTELREQMQLILQNVENTLANRKIKNPISPMKNVSNSYHLEASESSNQVAESRTNTFVYEQSVECETTTQERFSEEGLDELEEELEAEIQQMQMHLETEFKKLKREEEEEEEEEGRVLEHNYGVCPIELERRLHELLESRQEEKIKELEVVLERAKLKLLEKEREVSWWKNTASIISKHVPEPAFMHHRKEASS